MKSKKSADLGISILEGFSRSDLPHKELFVEYYQLSMRSDLSEHEQDRIDEILSLAAEDINFAKLLKKVDQLTYQELGIEVPQDISFQHKPELITSSEYPQKQIEKSNGIQRTKPYKTQIISKSRNDQNLKNTCIKAAKIVQDTSKILIALSQYSTQKRKIILRIVRFMILFFFAIFSCFVVSKRHDFPEAMSLNDYGIECSQILSSEYESDVIIEYINNCKQKLNPRNINHVNYRSMAQATVLISNNNVLYSKETIQQVLYTLFESSKLKQNAPRASFYRAFLKDFEELVLSESEHSYRDTTVGACPVIYGLNDGEQDSSGRYSQAINQYLSQYQKALKKFDTKNSKNKYDSVAPRENLNEEDAHILIELGHWLINRDRNMNKAIELNKIVLAHYGNSNNTITHNALASDGVAHFYLGNLDAAKKYFLAASEIEETAEIYNNLGTIYARSESSSYKEAARAYSWAARIETDREADGDYSPNKVYMFRRNEAFALLLAARFEDEPQGKALEAKAKYSEAYHILRKLESTQHYDEFRERDHLFAIAFGIATYHTAINREQFKQEELLYEAEKVLREAVFLNQETILPKLYLEIIEGRTHEVTAQAYNVPGFFEILISNGSQKDPFFEVEHDKFYCGPNDVRIPG